MLNPLAPVVAWWMSLSDYTQFGVLWVVLTAALLSALWAPARHRLTAGRLLR